MTDMREKARELAVKHGPSRETEAYHMYVRVLTEARNAALEEAAGVADGQAEYLASLTKTDLYQHRVDSVNAVAKLIRALKDKE